MFEHFYLNHPLSVTSKFLFMLDKISRRLQSRMIRNTTLLFIISAMLPIASSDTRVLPSQLRKLRGGKREARRLAPWEGFPSYSDRSEIG